MIIYPAIDILSGRCVRLYQGDYAQETIYHDNPIDMAKIFVTQGASWLHVVDLDGAKDPRSNQANLIKELLNELAIEIQVGGGIRSEEQIDAYLNAGASRVVLGSLAITNPSQTLSYLKKYGPERVVLAFDIKLDATLTPFVATSAWKHLSEISLFNALSTYSPDLKHVLCTDISRDGVLCGPNIDLYQSLMHHYPELCIQASGGISSLLDLQQLKNLGLSGAITGRALYEKQFDLKEALLC
jgi:phosphoribosylformimino-5-aminoimidazole carboxamide ribotide isomerase